jgi:hypothetical protein
VSDDIPAVLALHEALKKYHIDREEIDPELRLRLDILRPTWLYRPPLPGENDEV